MGVFEALASLIIGFHKNGQLQGWLRLLFSMGASYFLGFNTAAGTALVAGGTWPFGIGMGMLTGAAMAFLAFTRASKKLTEGVTVAVPQKTIDDQFDGGRGPMVSAPK